MRDHPSERPILAERLRNHAVTNPRGLAFLHLKDGEAEAGRLDWQTLDQGARAVAAALTGRARPGDRALLLYRTGLDFILAFAGCLYSGVIPVAAPADTIGRRDRSLNHLLAVARDAAPSLVLSTAELLASIGGLAADAPELCRVGQLDTTAVDSAGGVEWSMRPANPAEIAYLQYSSGSTASPKGVAINQGALASMMGILGETYGYDGESRVVCWMPHFHDYGLIQGLLHPIYAGLACVIMSPASFVQRPLRWLRAITDFKATHSCGPNFAYEHCVRRIPEAQLAGIDLSSWRAAGNGAEPVRARTLADFAARFAPYGFRAESLHPSYGLAEATLIVTGVKRAPLAPVLSLRSAALEQHRVELGREGEAGLRHIVSCGAPATGTILRIVDPETRRLAPPRSIGEIWVAHGAVGQGYWGRRDDTATYFEARIERTGEGPFLRTGDLGFVEEGELYIVGRRKDLIIANGSNHHPEEIEWSAEQSHPQIRGGCTAAFAIDDDDGSRLVVMAEIAPARSAGTVDPATIMRAIRKAVSLEHGLHIDRLVLLAAGEIPKTTSGKIQRAACRAALLDGRLAIVRES
jgi:acyl-CoA synthetase (AMP-forming)/AMP-acid ligase II